MAKLKRDVHSLTNRNKIYGRQGDEIRIIRKADHGSIFEMISTGLRASTVHDDIDYEEEGLPDEGAGKNVTGQQPDVPPAVREAEVTKGKKKNCDPLKQIDLFNTD